ncbi:MAG: hypothetical protein KAS71_06520 [Bacteroidales bacterium]|nr:hypothetical protein [Bacteroidales bacterium]
MDFDLGNLVYILITIAFVIFTAIGKKKKRTVQPDIQQVENEPDIAEKPENYLSDKLKSLFGEYIDLDSSTDETEEVLDESVYGYVQDDPESENIDYDEEKLDSNYSTIDTLSKEEGLSSTMGGYLNDLKSNSIEKDPGTSVSQLSYVEEALKDFDAKKAILFSEIFKPKYF